LATDLHFLDLLELSACLRDREISSVEATRAQLDRIAAIDPQLGSYAFIMAEEAMVCAARADKEIDAGRYRGPLHGVPIAIKDLFFTQGIPTGAGMSIHRNFRPDEDATAVQRIREAGAVILGKLQMTEGAYSDYHPLILSPKNPWNQEYWTGISSSGPAVATAAGLCYGSLASDTGGSIRWPCAATGLTGLKPTWGRISRAGVFELAASLDHVGPIARSAADTAAMLAVLSGSDPKDPTSLPDPVPNYLSSDGARGLRIGVDPCWNEDDVDGSVQEVLTSSIAVFRELGAAIVHVTVPDCKQSVLDWSAACAVEAAVAHEGTYPERKDEYGPVLASVLEAGRTFPAMEFEKIVRRRAGLRGCFAALFREIDVLLIPVQPFAPITLNTIRTLGEQPELIFKLQRFTAPFDMTGDPTVTLPGGFTQEGLPIGFQLAAGHLGETKLLRAAKAFQGVTDWHRRHPRS
jgi:amidase